MTRGKVTEALYIGQAITPTCFWRRHDIAARLKFLFWFYRDITEI